jgi:fatty acid desaturase
MEKTSSAASSLKAIPIRLNGSLTAVHLLVNLYQFFVLPLYLLPLSLWWALTLVPVAALSNPLWSLVHEAIHDLFHPSFRVNVLAGRLLSIFFGAPFRVLRLSHLMHHRLNRSPLEGTELYDPNNTSRMRAGLGYYSQILGGLYLFEFVSPLPFFLPRKFLHLLAKRFFSGRTLAGMLVRSLVTEESIREIRTDGLTVLGLLGLSAACYGENWEFLATALITRAFLISFLDNVYHYRTPVDDVLYADNLWLPRPLSRALLHFNLHGLHHKNPSIPWVRLPEIFRSESRRFDGDYFTAALRQLSGPIPLWDLPRRRDQVVELRSP